MLKEQLLLEIEKKRKELIIVVYKTGLISTLSLQHSMELDSLLNQYDELKKV